jgi:uncharacterized LabA/DUF88 family protein
MRTCGKDTAVLIDGGFLRKTFEDKFTPKPTPGSKTKIPIVHITVAQVIKNANKVCDSKRLFRLYYYDSSPFDGKRTHPVSGREFDFGGSAGYSAISQFQNELARSNHVAFRQGHLSFRGWKYKPGFDLKTTPQESDIVPVLEQKSVDIKIGLDIAWLAIKRIVDRIIIVTGDSDFIPVMKFARKEGMEVILCSVTGGFRREMMEHADEFMELNLEK